MGGGKKTKGKRSGLLKRRSKKEERLGEVEAWRAFRDIYY